MPLEYSERQRNKLTWRYPRGESYMDVLHRLEPVIHELERQRRPVVVVAHRAVLRCLYGYLVGIDTKRVCFLPLPLHTVIKLTTSELGWKVCEGCFVWEYIILVDWLMMPWCWLSGFQGYSRDRIVGLRMFLWYSCSLGNVPNIRSRVYISVAEGAFRLLCFRVFSFVYA
jgi:hypothetical protein